MLYAKFLTMNLEIPTAVRHVFILAYIIIWNWKTIQEEEWMSRSFSAQKTELKFYDVCMQDFGGETYHIVATWRTVKKMEV